MTADKFGREYAQDQSAVMDEAAKALEQRAIMREALRDAWAIIDKLGAHQSDEHRCPSQPGIRERRLPCAHGHAEDGKNMNTVTMPGYGDSSTWAPCSGHPNDPRTNDVEDKLSDARDVCSEIRMWLDLADRGLMRGDLHQFAAAMESAKRYLDSLDFSEVCS